MDTNFDELSAKWSMDMERRKAIYRQKEQEALKLLANAAAVGDEATARLELERLMAFADLRLVVEKAASEVSPADSTLTYVVGSLFLYRCYGVAGSGHG